MSRILAIARATFSEAVRHRILYLLGIFAILLILFSRVLSMMTVGEDDKIIKDVGMSAISILGLLVTLFVGVGVIFREMERRTVQVTLAGPVARHEYVIGKYFGLASAITLNTIVMSVVLFAMLAFRGAFTASLITAVFMLWIELMFVTAVAIFFSSFSTPIFTALFTAAAYIVGHLTWSLTLLHSKLEGAGIAQAIVKGAYYVLPDLEYGDVRALAVHGLPIPAERILFASLWQLSYGAALILIACWAFRRRDLI